MTFYTANWNELGDIQFRRLELNSMLWFNSVNLANCCISGSAFGGPLGIYYFRYFFNSILINLYFCIRTCSKQRSFNEMRVS